MGIDEHAEEERAAKDEKLEKEKRLTAAGLELRHRDLHRKQGMSSRSRSRSVPKNVDPEVDGGVGPGNSSTTGKTRLRIDNESGDDATEALVRDMAFRRGQDSRRLKLEKQRDELEKRRIVDKEWRFDANEESKRRKIIFEEKKAAVEIEGRKQAMVERARKNDVFAALAMKLE